MLYMLAREEELDRDRRRQACRAHDGSQRCRYNELVSGAFALAFRWGISFNASQFKHFPSLTPTPFKPFHGVVR